ncbi:MAG: hypothetical protein ABSH16_11890 [Sedimentisphaerales bacterium]
MNAEHRTSNVERSTNKAQFEVVGGGLLVRAPGKINISLLVKGKRADGFHNIESIMAKIDWYDEIVIERDTRYLILDSRKKETQIELVCKGEYKVPEGEGNLVYKAAEEILKIKNQKVKRKRETKEQDGGIKITLTKNMPAGYGLRQKGACGAGGKIRERRCVFFGWADCFLHG